MYGVLRALLRYPRERLLVEVVRDLAPVLVLLDLVVVHRVFPERREIIAR